MGSMHTPPAGTPGSGPFARFRQDHAAVRQRLDTLEAWLHGGADAAPLRPAIEHLERQFATHMAAEDAVLFPAVREAFPASRETLAQLAADHAEMRSMLKLLAARAGESSDGDEQLRVVARDLVDLLRLHVQREETAVFDVATRALPPEALAALAARMSAYAGPGEAGGPAGGA